MKRIAALCAGAVLLFCVVPSACSSKPKRTFYRIDAEYFPEQSCLSAVMEANVVNVTENALTSLPFQLWANAYREGAKVSLGEIQEYGGIDILSVKGGTYSVGGEDDNILTVTLPEPLYPDERAVLEIAFEVKIPAVSHRLGRGEHAVNLGNFYPVLCPYGEEGFLERVYTPCGDPFVSDCSDYDVTLRVPNDFVVMGAEKTDTGYSLKAENVRDVAFVIGKGFSKVETEEDGVKIVYAYFDDDAPDRALKAAKDSLSFFSKTFSPYIYPVYWVVQTDFPYGGMEYPMLSMISSSLTSTQMPYVVAHETAHQWWYAMVGSDQFAEAWQDEGLAEYSVALLAEHDSAYGDYRELVEGSERAYRAFFSVSSQVSGEADTRMSRPLTEFRGLYEYRSIAYDKGVILFDRVRLVAGEKKLRRALSLYADRYTGKIASRADMVACFSAAGARVQELFTSFLDGKCVI